MATTGFCNSAKAELLQGAHLFGATLASLTCTGSNAAFTLTGLSSTAGIASGMGASGTNVASGAIVATVDSASQVTLSKANTGAVTAASFTGDAFFISLVKVSPSLTYSATQTNIGTPGSSTPTTANLGTDEVASGGGYTSGGQQLTNNTTPVLSSTTAVTTWSNNPTWTSATFSTTAGIIYNSTATHLGSAAAPLGGRTISVHDFGGTQTVSAGTLTLLLPSATSSTAILRIA